MGANFSIFGFGQTTGQTGHKCNRGTLSQVLARADLMGPIAVTVFTAFLRNKKLYKILTESMIHSDTPPRRLSLTDNEKIHWAYSVEERREIVHRKFDLFLMKSIEDHKISDKKMAIVETFIVAPFVSALNDFITDGTRGLNASESLCREKSLQICKKFILCLLSEVEPTETDFTTQFQEFSAPEKQFLILRKLYREISEEDRINRYLKDMGDTHDPKDVKCFIKLEVLPFLLENLEHPQLLLTCSPPLSPELKTDLSQNDNTRSLRLVFSN